MDSKNLNKGELGLPFLYSYQQWAGGVIYFINIISALKLVEESRRPRITVLYTANSPVEDVKQLGYPDISFKKISIEFNLFNRIKNKLFNIILNKSPLFHSTPEIIYPYDNYVAFGKKRFYWIPDFQDKYLPEMFSQKDLDHKQRGRLIISRSKGVVVFSSITAMRDFEKFFPGHNCDLRVLRFACILPSFRHIDINKLIEKYDIAPIYFMSPNQFWKHKNHMVILKAVNILKDKNYDFHILFSGSENDYRNKDYFASLKEYVAEKGIEKWVKFLGFLDRADQLSLMDNSLAIIQPSLFEGWSTVVEDSKSLSQLIILSDLEVHKEQISENCQFFSPTDHVALSEIIEKTILTPPIRKQIDYTENIREFGYNILNVLDL